MNPGGEEFTSGVNRPTNSGGWGGLFRRLVMGAAVVLAWPHPGVTGKAPPAPLHEARNDLLAGAHRRRIARRAAEAAEAAEMDQRQRQSPEVPLPRQRVHQGPPPMAPGERNLEGGRLPVSPRLWTEPEAVWRRSRYVNTNSPAASPGAFNPDPGGKPLPRRRPKNPSSKPPLPPPRCIRVWTSANPVPSGLPTGLPGGVGIRLFWCHFPIPAAPVHRPLNRIP